MRDAFDKGLSGSITESLSNDDVLSLEETSEINRLKEERDKHKEKFWENMNSLRNDLRDEQEARKLADTKMKGTLGTITAVIAVSATAAVNWIFRQFK